MKILHWWWQLTKRVNGRRKIVFESGFRSLASEFIDIGLFLLWYLVTLSGLISIGMIFGFIWYLLPMSMQDFLALFLANFAEFLIWIVVSVWEIVLFLAQSIWTGLDPVKPFFRWFFNLDIDWMFGKIFGFWFQAMIFILVSQLLWVVLLAIVGSAMVEQSNKARSWVKGLLGLVISEYRFVRCYIRSDC